MRTDIFFTRTTKPICNFANSASGDFVAAVYENRWYIGRVVELDNLECEISFMAKSKNLFKWPNSPDEVWIP
jgi:hypothetical protein